MVAAGYGGNTHVPAIRVKSWSQSFSEGGVPAMLTTSVSMLPFLSNMRATCVERNANGLV